MKSIWTRRRHDTGQRYLHLVEPPQFCCGQLQAAWDDQAIRVALGSEQIEIFGEFGPPFTPHPLAFCPFCAAPIVMDIKPGCTS